MTKNDLHKFLDQLNLDIFDSTLFIIELPL
jgi:hypothetical protein